MLYCIFKIKCLQHPYRHLKKEITTFPQKDIVCLQSNTILNVGIVVKIIAAIAPMVSTPKSSCKTA
jgi:hypothetical protein